MSRTTDILDARRNHPDLTLRHIGEMYGVSAERVGQVLKAHGLPTVAVKPPKPPKPTCSLCGGPVSNRTVTICRQCRLKNAWVTLTCTTCKKQFPRRQGDIDGINRNPAYTTKRPFCSPQCFGRYVGTHYRPQSTRVQSFNIGDAVIIAKTPSFPTHTNHQATVLERTPTPSGYSGYTVQCECSKKLKFVGKRHTQQK